MQEMFTANILIFLGFLNMVGTHQKQIICSLGIMLIVVSRALKPYACSLHTRSSIQKTSFFYGGIMNLHPLTVYMAFMMSARGDIMSVYGKFLLIVLTAFQLLRLLMERYFACMGVYLLS